MSFSNLSLKGARNVAIVFALAAAAYFIPGGRVASELIGSAVTVVFLGLIAWFVARLYRQRRVDLLSLPESQRGLIYFGVVALLLMLTAL